MTETNACQANLVRISVGVNATAPVDLLATLKIVLVDRSDWHIDDRDRCLQGQSIVVIVISVNVRTDLVRIALLWVINVMLVDHTEISTDRGDRHIDDREQCLRGRSIVTIVSGNVIALRRLHYCLGATALMWRILYMIDFYNGNAFGIFSTGQHELYWS